ncbi:MAG: co-chaperone GroES [Ignavibacteriaceae bacterium]|nr:co-chaperone GroES [Ignavibacteriaceae bacterium]
MNSDVIVLRDLRKLIVVGDKVLIRSAEDNNKTNSGLYLPPGVSEKEKVQSGYIIKAGPGYPIPPLVDEEEPWKEKKESMRYIPLQAKEGDLAIFLRREVIEIEYEKEKLLIVPQSAILLLIREDFLGF